MQHAIPVACLHITLPLNIFLLEGWPWNRSFRALHSRPFALFIDAFFIRLLRGSEIRVAASG